MRSTSASSLVQRALHSAQARFVWRCCWALLCAVVAIAALTPGASAPTMSPSDKIDHLLAFAALAAAGALSMSPRICSHLVVACSMLVFGAAIEWGQTLVPGRFGDLADLVADGVGVLAGLVAVTVLRRILPA